MDGMGRVLDRGVRDAAAIADGPGAGPVDWPECWSRALVCERRRRTGPAAAWAAALAMHVTDGREIPLAAHLDAARLLKRVLEWGHVEQVVNAGLATWPQEPRLHYEAAVLYEHRLDDPARALVHAEAMGDEHRIERLRVRLERS